MSRNRRRATGVLAAVLAPVLLWVATVQVAGHELAVPAPDGRVVEVALPAVIVLSLVPSLLGWGLLALLERITRWAHPVWTVLAVLVLLLSFTPLLDTEIAATTRIVLGLMHVLVAAILIAAMLRRPATSPSTSPLTS